MKYYLRSAYLAGEQLRTRKGERGSLTANPASVMWYLTRDLYPENWSSLIWVAWVFPHGTSILGAREHSLGRRPDVIVTLDPEKTPALAFQEILPSLNFRHEGN